MKFIKNILLNNLSIKFISMILALLTWSYIGGQLYRESVEKESEAPSVIKVTGEKFIVKTLPIYVNIEGEPTKGYRIVLGKIEIKPSHSVVAGPPDIIKDLSYLLTVPIAVEAKTSTVKESVSLTSIPGCKIGYEGLVKIVIPIQREKRR